MVKLKVMRSIRTWHPWYSRLLLLLMVTGLISACSPKFSDPEKLCEAIYVSLVHDDSDYIKAVMASREDLDALYRDLSDDPIYKEKLDEFYVSSRVALPGAMDNFRTEATRLRLNLATADLSSADLEDEEAEWAKDLQVPLRKGVCWFYENGDSYVLVIRHMIRINDRWVIAYPEFEWMTSDDYYNQEYDNEYDDFDSLMDVIEEAAPDTSTIY